MLPVPFIRVFTESGLEPGQLALQLAALVLALVPCKSQIPTFDNTHMFLLSQSLSKFELGTSLDQFLAQTHIISFSDMHIL